MAESNYDEVLGKICKEVVCIESFLDVIFGYLCRCTDFFTVNEVIKEDEAKETTLKTLEKWKKLSRERDKREEELRERLQSDGIAPAAINEVEVQSEDVASDESQVGTSTLCSDSSVDVSAAVREMHIHNPEVPAGDSSAEPPRPGEEDHRYYAADSKCYNGAVRDCYCWAQSITDLDVTVPVPSSVVKGRQVRVAATNTSLEVSVLEGSEWRTLVSGDLCWKVSSRQLLWSLEPAKQVQIHLEKTEERWWDAIFVSEPKIDLSAIDASRPLEDLGEDVEMKLQEMVWNEKRKKEGLPTSDQLANAKLLKEAWNLEGSPFAGTPYDPSVLCPSADATRVTK